MLLRKKARSLAGAIVSKAKQTGPKIFLAEPLSKRFGLPALTPLTARGITVIDGVTQQDEKTVGAALEAILTATDTASIQRSLLKKGVNKTVSIEIVEPPAPSRLSRLFAKKPAAPAAQAAKASTPSKVVVDKPKAAPSPAKDTSQIEPLQYKWTEGQKASLGLGLFFAIGLAAIPFAPLVIPIFSGIASAISFIACGVLTRSNRQNFKGVGILFINDKYFSKEQQQTIKDWLIQKRLGGGVHVYSIDDGFLGRWVLRDQTLKDTIESQLKIFLKDKNDRIEMNTRDDQVRFYLSGRYGHDERATLLTLRSII